MAEANYNETWSPSCPCRPSLFWSLETRSAPFSHAGRRGSGFLHPLLKHSMPQFFLFLSLSHSVACSHPWLKRSFHLNFQSLLFYYTQLSLKVCCVCYYAFIRSKVAPFYYVICNFVSLSNMIHRQLLGLQIRIHCISYSFLWAHSYVVLAYSNFIKRWGNYTLLCSLRTPFEK